MFFRNKIYTTSGIYFDTLTNAQFCDSIIKIDLSITRVDTSVTINSNILIANATNATYQWLRCGFGLISGANQKSYIPLVSGEYAVIVKQQNCFLVAVTGVQTNLSQESILIYPNPTNGILNIEMQKSIQNFDVKLFALDGKLLDVEISKINQNIQLDLGSFKSGIYFLQLTDELGRSYFYKANKN